MRKITRHIIHCSDTLSGSCKAIRQYHTKINGWTDIGYHFVIKQDGTIEVGRPLEKTGAHCRGYNSSSIGTCLIGRNVFTKEQYKSLNQIHKTLKSIFKDIKPVGHSELTDKKTCPNFDVSKYLK